jgi:hypothetical protein
LARKAVELGRDDEVALAMGRYALAFVGGEQDIGSAYVDRALKLNPNLPSAWYADAWLRIWRGEPEIALRHFVDVARLSPFEPMMAVLKSSIMFAHCMIGQHEQSLFIGRASLTGKSRPAHGIAVWRRNFRARKAMGRSAQDD